MELPKNITQIGESDQRCKVYAEDYVVSYLKQLNQQTDTRNIAAALYGIRKEENNVSYIFFYGAAKINSIQKEVRHLSQAQSQEIEKLRKRFFPDYQFMGYRILNGEMVEGFHICEQGTCRYISGYACFYEKNDRMLAYMLDSRKEDAPTEVVDQEKYDRIRKRQEERRAQYRGSLGYSMGKNAWQSTEPDIVQPGTIQPGTTYPDAVKSGTMQGNSGFSDMRPEMSDMSEKAAEEAAWGSVQEAGQFTERNSRMVRSRATRQGAAGAGRRDAGNNRRDSRAYGRTQGAYRGRQVGRAERKAVSASPSLKMMRMAVVGMFLLLCVLGIATLNDLGNVEDIQTAARQLIAEFTEQKIPDAEDNVAASGQNDTLITEDKLTEALQQENNAQQSGQQDEQQDVQQDVQNQSGTDGQANGQETQTTEPDQTGQNGQETQATQPSQSAQNNQDTQSAQGTHTDQNNEVTQPDQNTQQSQEIQQPTQPANTTTAQQPSQETSAPVTYTIKKGDTLSAISVRTYGTDAKVKDICELNQIENPDDIRFGQKILLP